MVRRLREAGHTAYFAGGCVRDELLGLAPKDYDVACDAPAPRLAELFPGSGMVGASFGVVIVRELGHSVEVATFRSDGPYDDRRRPTHITATTPEGDARRRDFTVNALFLDPLDGDRVIDHVEGLRDLQRRLLRAVGDPDARLAEDHLRALRGVRLAARLGFDIDPGTSEAIRSHASALAGVSRERIGEEIRRMMTHGSRLRAVELLEGLGLDGPVLMEPARVCVPRRSMAAIGGGPEEAALGLAAWALDRGALEGDVEQAVRRWRDALMLSNEDRGRLAACLGVLVRVRARWRIAGVVERRRLLGESGFDDCVRCLGGLDAELAREISAAIVALGPNPEPVVDGDDLVKLGLPPGPRYKELLEAIYDAQLEGRVRTRAEGLELLRRLVV